MDKYYGYRVVNEYGKKIIQLEPGEEYNGFDKYAQYGATYEEEDINWDQGTTQRKIFEVWKSQGKKTDNNNISFITMGNGDWYLVAMGTSMGNVGDYVEISIKNRAEPFPAIIADRKSGSDAGAVFALDKKNLYWHLGHGSEGKVNMLEIILKNYKKKPSPEYLAGLQTVTAVKNGGSYIEHPDGPVGLTGSYKIEADLTSIENNSSTSSNRSTVKNEELTLAGAILSFFRSLATMSTTFIDNIITGREDADNMQYLENPDALNAQQNSSNPNMAAVGDANVIVVCKQLTKYLMECGAHYARRRENWRGLVSHDIEKNFENPDYNIVCATYVTIVLWKSGKLTTDFINKGEYNYNGSWGIPKMLEDAGWTNIAGRSDVTPTAGDVIVDNPGPNRTCCNICRRW